MNQLSFEDILEKSNYNTEYEYKIYMKDYTPLTSCEWVFINDNIHFYFYNKKKDMYLFFKQQEQNTFLGKLYPTYMEYFYDDDDNNNKKNFIFMVFDYEYEETGLK